MIDPKELTEISKFYDILRNGKVFSIKRGRTLKEDYSSWYPRVTLSLPSGVKKYSVHRLVASMFIKNDDNKPCVNHKDGNKANNDYKNLEWCTYSENERHSHSVLGKQISN